MVTFVDLILKVVGLISGEHARISAAKRDRVDRIADYLLRISDGLHEAAEQFATEKRPWRQIKEMAEQSQNVLAVIGDDIANRSFGADLQRELEGALHSDYLLLQGSVELEALDRIVIKPSGRGYDDVETDPLKKMTPHEIKEMIAGEIQKLEEASGLFRAASHKLRASAT